MATKITVRDEFVAPDDMADIDYRPLAWDELDAPDSEIALDVTPDVERDYFDAMRVAKLEKLAAKRSSQTNHRERAESSEEFQLLSEVCQDLNVHGARSVVLEYAPGKKLALTAGNKNRYPLARVHGEKATVYTKVTTTRMTPRGQDSVTQIIGYAVEAETLIDSIYALAKNRVPLYIPSAMRVEIGKTSRKKWQSAQSRMRSHESGVLRTQAQHAQAAARESIAAKIAAGTPIGLEEWKAALGRPLVKAEKMAAKRYAASVAAGHERRAQHMWQGQSSVMARLINSLERK